jgi:phosphate acetyltransferase
MFFKNKNPFLEKAYKKAKLNPQMIVYPEANLHDKTLQAAIQVANAKIAYPILLGPEKELIAKIKQFTKKVPDNIQIHDPTLKSAQKEYYIQKLFEIRKHKNLTLEQAAAKLDTIDYYGIMMLEADHCHGLISGATSPTSQTVRPAFEVIKAKTEFHKVSGFFFMLLEKQTLLFADCAINVNPTAQELAEIGIDTALTAKKFGLDPKVAFLSFSTNGSASNIPEAAKVKEACQIAKKLHPELCIEGEMQVDAALVPEVAATKFANSKIKGNANVLVFPDLNSGNIAYKLVERLAKAKAIGPLLQGLNKPVNDLSRGCSVQDIVDLTALTSVEAQNETYF